MKLWIAAALLALAWVAAPQPDPVIFEDDPGWNCSTMGNKVCGPGVESDTGSFIGGFN